MEVLPLDALPVGYRFSPTDYELINHFLRSKITGNEDAVRRIREVDLCKWEPWDLPALSLIETNDDKWVFFCPKDCKFRTGKRSNRATKAGYWKATGKDRSIKAVNGTTEIGTKKTLVFHKGRAPKGQRTNWVIHEYCATSKELGGSDPGQGSFVLFKLIKKHDKKLERNQDESTEGLNCVEVAENVSSPATVISFMPSELVTPMNAQAEKLPSSSESHLAQKFESFHDSFVADDPDFEQEVLRHLVDLEQPDPLAKIFSLSHLQMQPNLDSMHNLHRPVSNDVGPDYNGIQFQYGTNEQDITEFLDSVLKAPPSINCLHLVSNNESDAEVAQVQFDPEQFEQNEEIMVISDISNEEDLRYFPLLENDFLEQSFVSIASAGDQPYDLFNSPEGSSNNSDSVSNDETFGTGINLRTRQPHDHPSFKNFGPQGNAPRRIRLLQKPQAPSFYCSNNRDFSFEEESHEKKLVLLLAKAEELEEKLSAIADPAAIVDDAQDAFLSKSNKEHLSDRSCDLFNSPEGSSNVVNNGDTFGTGIKLRTHLPHNQPSSKNFGPQGNAPRSIRLKKKLRVQLFYRNNFRDLSYKEQDHEAKVVVAKAEEKDSVTDDPASIVDEAQDTSLSKSNSVTKVAQESAWNVKSGSDFPRGGDKEVHSASSKVPLALQSIFSAKHIIGVLLAVGLSIVIMGLLRYFEF